MHCNIVTNHRFKLCETRNEVGARATDQHKEEKENLLAQQDIFFRSMTEDAHDLVCIVDQRTMHDFDHGCHAYIHTYMGNVKRIESDSAFLISKKKCKQS